VDSTFTSQSLEVALKELGICSLKKYSAHFMLAGVDALSFSLFSSKAVSALLGGVVGLHSVCMISEHKL